MYFTLEINENLTNAMRALAEAKRELLIFQNKEESREAKRMETDDIDDIDGLLCDAMLKVGQVAGFVIANDALTEV